jgi:hypothetical protein
VCDGAYGACPGVVAVAVEMTSEARGVDKGAEAGPLTDLELYGVSKGSALLPDEEVSLPDHEPATAVGSEPGVCDDHPSYPASFPT